MYSIAKKYSPSSSPTSWTWTMFGWCSVAARRASSRNIGTKRWSLRVLGADPLEHDVALEALDAVGAREQHVGHAARREMLQNRVPPEPLDTHLRVDRTGARPIGSS